MLYHVGRHEKLPLLLGVLQHEKPERTLMFVNTKREAEWLTQRLADNGFHAGALTGDLHQRVRLRVLREFKAGTLPILVATDVASRGLHIDGVTHVVNYDVPQDAEDYVHRIGRTARAGASGRALTLACETYVDGARGDRSADRISSAGDPRRGRHAGETGTAVAQPSRSSGAQAAPQGCTARRRRRRTRIGQAVPEAAGAGGAGAAQRREGAAMFGTIKSIVRDKGFGFIVPDDGSDEVFFHRTKMAPKVYFEDLREGEEVEFQVHKGEKGPQAFNLKPR